MLHPGSGRNRTYNEISFISFLDVPILVWLEISQNGGFFLEFFAMFLGMLLPGREKWYLERNFLYLFLNKSWPGLARNKVDTTFFSILNIFTIFLGMI